MKTKLIYTVIVLLCVTVASCSFLKDTEMKELLANSSVASTIDELDMVLTHNLLSKDISNVELVKEYYEGAEMKKNIIKYLKEHTNKDSLNKLMEEYDHPFWVAASHSVERQRNPEKQRDREAYLEKLKTNPLSESRYNTIKELTELIGEVEIYTKLLGKIHQSGYKNLSLVAVQAKGVDTGWSESIYNDLKRKTLNQNLYTYSRFTDKQLEGYVRFLKSPISVYYKAQIMKAFDYASDLASQQLGQHLKS